MATPLWTYHAGLLAMGQSAVATHVQAKRDRTKQLAWAQSDHEQSVNRERARVRRQHAVIDQIAHDFAEGKRKAVAERRLDTADRLENTNG